MLNLENLGNKRSLSPFLTALLIVTIINYAVAFAAIVLFYLYYTQPDGCTEHKVFISLNLIFCLLVSVVSILPKVQVWTRLLRRLHFPLSSQCGALCWRVNVMDLLLSDLNQHSFYFLARLSQEAQPSSGLLQASIISLYTMYVTWSAMTNNPSE